ncbi:MAG: hypothetical protein AB1422_15705 [bacterium]
MLQRLVEGNGIRAPERITGLSKDTVNSLLDKVAQHIEKVSELILKDIEAKESSLVLVFLQINYLPIIP